MKPLLVVGLGYVGYPLLLSLGRKHDVIGLDIDKEKVVRISCGFPILGSQTEADLLSSGNLSLRATSSLDDIPEVEAAFLCLPTDYDEEKRGLDTSGLEQTIAALLAKQPDMAIFIRSTVGIGFTRTMCLRHPKAKIAFFPEFLREKSALEDVLHPSRLILGTIDDALEDLF
ncbi:MAG: UDP-glucose 6-dehydrogenase, partial [Bacilli bacterium]|nr:UDP-glucose 6-dehydrogenase [Bacilli bacterium]